MHNRYAKESKVGHSFFVVCGVILVFMAVWVCVGLIVAPLLMYAWNATMPFIFALPVIGYWHAFWLWVLVGFMRPQANATAKKD